MRPVPTADGADVGVETGGQLVGAPGQDRHREEAVAGLAGIGRKVVHGKEKFGRAGMLPHLSERADQLEAEVVVRLAFQQAGERKGVFGRKVAEPLFFGFLVNLPQYPRVETAAPPVDAGNSSA